MRPNLKTQNLKIPKNKMTYFFLAQNEEKKGAPKQYFLINGKLYRIRSKIEAYTIQKYNFLKHKRRYIFQFCKLRHSKTIKKIRNIEIQNIHTFKKSKI